MARFRITPTTAAVIPVNGAVNFRLPCVVSISGPPIRMNKKDGKKVECTTKDGAKCDSKCDAKCEKKAAKKSAKKAAKKVETKEVK